MTVRNVPGSSIGNVPANAIFSEARVRRSNIHSLSDQQQPQNTTPNAPAASKKNSSTLDSRVAFMDAAGAKKSDIVPHHLM